MAEKEKLYRLETVAKRLHLSVRQVRNLINQGKLEGTRLSERKWRVSQTALEEYLRWLRKP